MSITVRAPGTTSFTANNVPASPTLTPGAPAAKAVGDLLLLICESRSNTATVATPNGWNVVSGFPKRSGTASGGTFYVFSRIADGSATDTPSPVWSGLTSGTSGDSSGATIIAIAGAQEVVDGGTVQVSDLSAQTSTSVIPAFTTLVNGSIVIGLAMKILESSGQTSTVATFTEVVDASTTSGTGHIVEVSYKTQATAGSSGTATVTWSATGSARALAVSLGFKAAPVPITPTSAISATSTVGGTVTAKKRITPTTAISATSSVSGEITALTASKVTFGNTVSNGGSPATLTMTCSGENRYLVFSIVIAGQTVYCTGVTYDGVPMEKLGRNLSPNGVELWGLVAPSTTPNATLAISLSGSSPGHAAGATCFTNVDQGIPTGGAAVAANGSGTTATSASRTVSNRDMLVDVINAGSNVTVVAPGVQAWNDGTGDAAQYAQGTGSAQTLSWTLGSSGGWNELSAVLKVFVANIVGAISAPSTVGGAVTKIGATRAITPTTAISATSTFGGNVAKITTIAPTTGISATSSVSGAFSKIPGASTLTKLQLFLSNTADTLVTTAQKLQRTAGGTFQAKQTQTGQATGWGILYSKGTSNAWAAAGSEPAFGDVNGFILDDTSLENATIPAGSSWSFQEYMTTTNGTVTGIVHCRVGKRSSSGVYTEIVNMASSSVGLTSTAQAVTGSGTQASDVTFNAGDTLYVQYEMQITANTSSSGTATTAIRALQGNANVIRLGSLVLSNGYEGNTDGANISAGGNIGDVNNADGTGVGAGNTVKFDGTKALTAGSMSVKHAMAAVANAYWSWTQAAGQFGAQTDYYIRGYFQTDTIVANQELITGVVSTYSWKIQLNASGQVVLCAGSTSKATSSHTISTGQTFRVEAHIDHTNNAITCRLFIGANSEGSTPDEEFSYTGQTMGNANDTQLRIGPQSSNTLNLWSDGIAMATAGWLGSLTAAGGQTRAITPAAINATSTFGGSVAKITTITPAALDVITTEAGDPIVMEDGVTEIVMETSGVAIFATSTVSSGLRATRRIAPQQISATSIVGGSLRAIRKVAPSGISATSTVSGAVTKIGVSYKAITPTSVISATSSVSGAVSFRRPIVPNVISATSSVSGFLRRVRPITPSQIAATSAVTGGVLKRAAISGVVSATSTVSGAVRAFRRVTGAIAATSSIANISVRVRRAILPQQISATSTVSGSLRVKRRILPTGISATSTYTATLGTRRRLVFTSVAATSSITGIMAKLGVKMIVPTTISATSTFNAVVGTRRKLVLQAINATSAVSGTHRVLTPIIPTTISATSTISGKVVRIVRIPATAISATSAVSGNVVRIVRLPPTVITATSTVSGAVYKLRPITGNIVALSTLTGDIMRLRRIAGGQISATSTLTAVVSIAPKLGGRINATSTMSGNIRIGYIVYGRAMPRIISAGYDTPTLIGAANGKPVLERVLINGS